MRAALLRLILLVVAVGVLGGALPSSAQAQATRTWVSGVGDDANPCSRTAPCKTFAGAISKTAAGGEIDALDPGGFGAVTITKSITLNGSGTQASVLVSGTNAIIVNAAATDRVVLRELELQGLCTGLNGVRVLSAGTLRVEDVSIAGFATSGISLESSAASGTRAFVNDTSIENGCGSSLGVNVAPTGAGVADVVLRGVSIFDNGTGVSVGSGGAARLADSSVAYNTVGLATSGTGVIESLGGNVVSGNGIGWRVHFGALGQRWTDRTGRR